MYEVLYEVTGVENPVQLARALQLEKDDLTVPEGRVSPSSSSDVSSTAVASLESNDVTVSPDVSVNDVTTVSRDVTLPFKAIKSLSPLTYRNVALDSWVEENRGTVVY